MPTLNQDRLWFRLLRNVYTYVDLFVAIILILFWKVHEGILHPWPSVNGPFCKDKVITKMVHIMGP